MPKSRSLRVLHVAAEIYPWLKTGGLADVVAALPVAQANAGAEVRLLLPAMPAIAEAVVGKRAIFDCGPFMGAGKIRVCRGRMRDSNLSVYLLEAPYLYTRPGGPYQAPSGQDWPDNLQRFALLSWVAAHLAAGEIDPKWQPDITHAHDWHAGLTPAYMSRHPLEKAKSVFTIHNLAYQGRFAGVNLSELALPQAWMAPGAALEFHGDLSFMKAGLTLADHITTVSPNYAKEIMTNEFGAGLDGVIRARESSLTGILNGVDYSLWDPGTDPRLIENFDAQQWDGKARCKAQLQALNGLTTDPSIPVFGVVSRMTQQKGLDLLLRAMDALLREGAQLVLLGSGDRDLEQAFTHWAEQHPRAIGVRLGYDEDYAHRLIAGADALIIPSRFEPCGLTQLYAMRYGTLPVVRAVGGLADTVNEETGFCFRGGDTELADVLARTLACYRQPSRWQKKKQAAMSRDFSWSVAATEYLQLYSELRHPRSEA